MKNRKGAELSVNVIIIAIVALVVLVVLFAIFTGRMGIFTKSVSDCTGKGGRICGDASQCSDTENAIPGICPSTKDGKIQYCCMPK